MWVGMVWGLIGLEGDVSWGEDVKAGWVVVGVKL